MNWALRVSCEARLTFDSIKSGLIGKLFFIFVVIKMWRLKSQGSPIGEFYFEFHYWWQFSITVEISVVLGDMLWLNVFFFWSYSFGKIASPVRVKVLVRLNGPQMLIQATFRRQQFAIWAKSTLLKEQKNVLRSRLVPSPYIFRTQ